jgi:hypothetical protein
MDPITVDTEPSLPQKYHRYIPYGAAARAMSGVEEEHYSPDRAAAIDRAWMAGLHTAKMENKRLIRDIGTVRMTNPLWAV